MADCCYDIYDNCTDRFRNCCSNVTFARPIKGWFCGSLFAIAWWIWIDAYVYTVNFETTKHNIDVGWAPTVVASLGLIFVNMVDQALIEGDSYAFDGGDGSVIRGRIFLIFGFMTAFGGFSGSITVMITKYLAYESSDYHYIAGAICVHASLVLISTLLMRFWAPGESSF